ncbi:hypothetical protein ACFWBR_03785 [Streptomyces sp. NPDC060006]
MLPPAGYRTGPPRPRDGLVVTVGNKAGEKKEFDFAKLPAPERMRHSLAALFAAQSRRWTSHSSADHYWNQLLVFVRFLSRLDNPPEDLDGLTAAALKRWRERNIKTNTGRLTLATIRVLLRADPRLRTGQVAEELARRVPQGTPSKQSYEDAEREQVLLTAQRQFRAAWMRIRDNTIVLERWRLGQLPEGSREAQLGQILDVMACTGDVPRARRSDGLTNLRHRGLLGGGSVERTWGRLFLTRHELTALAVLLTDRFAWNLSVYDRMPAPTRAPSVGERTTVTYLVQVEKRRPGAGRWFSTENITDSGAASPGRLITQALDATAHGRALAAKLAPGTDLLMTARLQQVGRERRDLDRPPRIGPLVFGVSRVDATSWARSHGLSGSPFQRTRRTTVTREGRPMQHTQGTHESVYVLPDQRVQRASQAVFEAGAHEALQQAQATVFGGHLAREPNPAHHETATADCEDDTTSPWPAPDGGCAADFLLCLACGNAHVHPGHHPRLAHLHQQLMSLRSVLPDHTWTARWHDHLLRLNDMRDRVGPAAWNAALGRVSDRDRTVVALLLKGELAS